LTKKGNEIAFKPVSHFDFSFFSLLRCLGTNQILKGGIMKFILLSLCLVGASVFADQQNLPTISPIRQAKAHAYVYKYQVVNNIDKDGNGTSLWTRTKACDVEGAVNVYDYTLEKGGFKIPESPDFGSCDVILNGDPVTVSFNGSVTITQYDDSNEPKIKIGSGLFTVTSKDKDHPVKHNSSEFGSSASSDLSSNSLVTSLNTKSDAPGDAKTYEVLSADVDFMDSVRP